VTCPRAAARPLAFSTGSLVPIFARFFFFLFFFLDSLPSSWSREEIIIAQSRSSIVYL
jgi:hypothetical protein